MQLEDSPTKEMLLMNVTNFSYGLVAKKTTHTVKIRLGYRENGRLTTISKWTHRFYPNPHVPY